MCSKTFDCTYIQYMYVCMYVVEQKENKYSVLPRFVIRTIARQLIKKKKKMY